MSSIQAESEQRFSITNQEIHQDSLELNFTIGVRLSDIQDDVLGGPIYCRADEAMYAAKERGQNRVYINDGEQPALVGAPEFAI